MGCDSTGDLAVRVNKASASDRFELPGSCREVVPGATPLGPCEERTVDVIVRVYAAQELHSLEEWTVRPPSQRTYLTREQFASLYGARPEDLKSVANWAKEYGVETVECCSARRLVWLSGCPKALGEMFGTTLSCYRNGDGTVYRGREHSLSVPHSMKEIIEGVYGLDNRREASYHAADQPEAVPVDERVVDQLIRRYTFPEGLGAGQSIAILEFEGGFDPQVIQDAFANKGLSPRIEQVSILNAQNNPDLPGGPSLDLTVVGSVAPEANITVYFAPNSTAGWTKALSTAIHDRKRKHTVISISWAGDESLFRQKFVDDVNGQLQAAAALGVTVCCSSGNDGALGLDGETLEVRFPASSPYALGCGGTDCDDLESPAVDTDRAWNRGGGTSTGGGHSRRFEIPAWQSEAIGPVGKGRGVPDVSGHAGAYPVPMHGSLKPLGGTSAVAPLWAGLVARLNAKLPKPVGFLAPFLYLHRTEAVTDIARGGNETFEASPGWDPCTGLGAPAGTKLLELLAAD